jgi:hypothetical protein
MTKKGWEKKGEGKKWEGKRNWNERKGGLHTVSVSGKRLTTLNTSALSLSTLSSVSSTS